MGIKRSVTPIDGNISEMKETHTHYPLTQYWDGEEAAWRALQDLNARRMPGWDVGGWECGREEETVLDQTHAHALTHHHVEIHHQRAIPFPFYRFSSGHAFQFLFLFKSDVPFQVLES